METTCEYLFKCHGAGKYNDFSCAMCYCPLWHNTTCIGDYSLIVLKNNKVGKDCSKCLTPHYQPERIIKALKEQQDDRLE